MDGSKAEELAEDLQDPTSFEEYLRARYSDLTGGLSTTEEEIFRSKCRLEFDMFME